MRPQPGGAGTRAGALSERVDGDRARGGGRVRARRSRRGACARRRGAVAQEQHRIVGTWVPGERAVPNPLPLTAAARRATDAARRSREAPREPAPTRRAARPTRPRGRHGRRADWPNGARRGRSAPVRCPGHASTARHACPRRDHAARRPYPDPLRGVGRDAHRLHESSQRPADAAAIARSVSRSAGGRARRSRSSRPTSRIRTSIAPARRRAPP